jgi:uncharacterized lipoprotein NlpE involved in copper resistance
VIKYIFLKGNSSKQPRTGLLGFELETGHLSAEGKERSGRPTQMTIPENVDAFIP